MRATLAFRAAAILNLLMAAGIVTVSRR